MWCDFVTALSFLTLLHVPSMTGREPTPVSLARSFSFFPLVGFLLGGGSWGLALLLARTTPPFLLACILTLYSVLVTRAFHMDGLADFWDGLGGGYNPDRRLEIMKDSRTGAFGAVALSLAVALKIAALHALLTHRLGSPLLIVPAFSRLAMVLTAYKTPYARKEGGLGKPFLEHMSARELRIALGICLLLSAVVNPFFTLLCAATVLVFSRVMKRGCRKWFGGVTGDVLGAVNEMTEILLYALGAMVLAS
ncbi:MAG TPA: adenosylcobinamide-GDP ribazoletransferase [Syntrophobacteraceae bacterium]|nr:adenosylcobinamide-GDP ribazoletransferase [Syntrophobacteraceae bacterium]